MSKEYVKEGIKKALSDWDYAFKENEVMIAGGVFTSLFTNQEVNDIDCYFRSKRHMLRFILDIAENESYPYFVNITDKSMTLTAPGEPTIQLIYFKYFDNLQEVFETFDFTISMCGYDYKTDEIQTAEDFWSDLSQRRLSFNSKTAFPLVSALRVNKFKDRGYKISRSQMIKVMLEVTKLDLKTPEDFVKHVGGHYGNAALKILQEEGEFSLDKALEKLSELEGDNNKNILLPNVKEFVAKDSMSLKAMVRILAACAILEGGWYRVPSSSPEDSPQACYLRGKEDYHKSYLPLNIALLFAKDKERKAIPNTAKRGIYFKHVHSTDDTGVYKSIYDETFEYELGKTKQDAHGMYLCTKDKISTHLYSRRGGVVIACEVDFEDIISEQNGEFRVKKLTPLFEVAKGTDIASTYGNISPDISVKIPLDVSEDLNQDIDLEILDELLGYEEPVTDVPVFTALPDSDLLALK